MVGQTLQPLVKLWLLAGRDWEGVRLIYTRDDQQESISRPCTWATIPLRTHLNTWWRRWANAGPMCGTLALHWVNPANTRRWTNGALMWNHRLRRWPNIKSALGKVLCLLGKCLRTDVVVSWDTSATTPVGIGTSRPNPLSTHPCGIAQR